MTLKELLKVIPANELILLRSYDGFPCTRWIRTEDEYTYGARQVKEICTTMDDYPVIVIRIEGEIV